MNQIYMKSMMVASAMMLTVSANAFENEGVNYEVLSEDEKTVEVVRSNEGYAGDVVIPDSVDGYAVKKIADYAFYGCEEMTSITLPNTIEEIGEFVFTQCNGLTSFDMPQSVVSTGSNLFSECENLEEVTISENLDEILPSTFEGCINLRSVVIPESVKKIYSAAFYGCESLQSIKLPSALKKIDEATFAGCVSLEEVEIPNQVTTIGLDAFCECTNLRKIVIPETVTKIQESAFYECVNLKHVVNYAATPQKISNAVFRDIDFKSARLVVEKGCKAAYAVAEGWQNFAQIDELDATGIEETVTVNAKSNAKSFENGQLVIKSNGKKFNAAGVLVK